VSYGSGHRLPIEVGSDIATNLAAPCGPWDSSIKKILAVLLVQLGTHVPNAHAQVFKADNKVIMGLQDVRADSAVNICKVCRQTATVRLQCSDSTVNHHVLL
jgi:hypothetical protein